MNHYGCEVLGVEADHGDTADIVIHIAESVGPQLFTNIPVTEIDGWSSFTDHSRPNCCPPASDPSMRDRAPLTPTAVAHPDPAGVAGSGTNFKEDR